MRLPVKIRFGFAGLGAALLAAGVLGAPAEPASYLDEVGASLSLHPRVLFQAIRGGDGRESRDAKIKLVGFAEKAGLEPVRRRETRFEKEVRKSCARANGSEDKCLDGLDRRKKDLARLEELFGTPMKSKNVPTRMYVSAVIYLHAAMESVLDPALARARAACGGESGKSAECRRKIHRITRSAALIDDIARLAASRAGLAPLDEKKIGDLEGSIERRLAVK